MAILDHLGVLSEAHDLTNGAVDSQNVIDLGAVANVNFNQMFLDIECETAIGAAAGTTSTFLFELVVASEATLDTYRRVCCIDIRNNVADPRIAAANRHIAAMEIGNQVGQTADATYRYLGLICTLADGNGTATVSINAAISPSKPRTRDNVQVTRSNVTIPS